MARNPTDTKGQTDAPVQDDLSRTEARADTGNDETSQADASGAPGPLADGPAPPAGSDGGPVEGAVPEDLASRRETTITFAAHSIRVIGPKQGRWRIGRKFGADPVDIPVSGLTADELRMLMADPDLIVAPVPVTEPDE